VHPLPGDDPAARRSDPLDAHGAAIVTDLQDRAGAAILPVFMKCELRADSAFLEEDEKQCNLVGSVRRAGRGRPARFVNVLPQGSAFLDVLGFHRAVNAVRILTPLFRAGSRSCRNTP